ncbi:winged helix-turn-helix domain-containing protein [Cellulomonas fengjieae]|uniref:Helix-turn-helix transcriptional regulator n=1 Tax=Cellulomonas fengjieae TaxID=2819978 RepID=A0ABS3SCN1_9CELL|nr:helix-turn-helix domain-containing protein [Cellulomonas fengjieae]MBO3083264.1 helix-turn-helix transcriptional regulator [Cellulomonas fengjieae]QVI65385.1 helix-turn-helix transcriptional regulator [Cellulomonas fengjieae]
MSESNPLSFRARAIGPEELKALAHPLRMAMYDYLAEHGSATASQLARHLGESSGQTSYHLRQLEKHGFVEDDPAHQRGRDRWWRAVGYSVDGGDMLRDPRTAEAASALLQGVVAERAQVLGRWMAEGDTPQWEEASLNDRSTADLTLDEMREVVHGVQAIIDGAVRRAKERKAAGDTEGRRRVRIYFDALPLPLDGA